MRLEHTNDQCRAQPIATMYNNWIFIEHFGIHVYRRVGLLSACAYNYTARKVGLIIQGVLINQGNLQWVWFHIVHD